MVDENVNVGPWSDADFKGTALSERGVGVEDGMPSALRFRSNVAKLVRRRLAVDDRRADRTTPAIFLLLPTPPSSAGDTKRVPMLDNGQSELSGRLWFVGPSPSSGRYISCSAEDDDALFKLIEEMTFGDVEAIVFDPRVPSELRHYSKGIGSVDECELIQIGSVEITLDSVVAAVEKTYLHKMITPDAQPKEGPLWENEGKAWPKQNAEGLVQMYLEIALGTAFPTCTIRAEQGMPEGRLDIEIVEQDPVDRSIELQHGLLELKVLRSRGATGRPYTDKSIKDWIKSGVEQASEYRDRKGAKWSALFCFDMRADDLGEAKCFSHVKRMAATLSVHLRRWYIYSSSAKLRSASVAKKLTSAS